MKVIRVIMLISALAAYTQAASPEENPVDATRKILVEGVAGSAQAAPIAVLREIGERIIGRSFSVLHGKYVAFSEEAIPTPLDTKRKKVVSIDRLGTGLYKAVIEVEGPPQLGELEIRLRERIQQGSAALRSAGGPLLARERAREDAMEQAVLVAVAERYPGESAPPRLAGRVFFLGTINEGIEDENYVILSRIKVKLVEP